MMSHYSVFNDIGFSNSSARYSTYTMKCLSSGSFSPSEQMQPGFEAPHHQALPEA
jgi:hypothetical protein